LKFTGERDQLENEMVNLRLLNEELQSKYVLLQVEVERLNRIINDKDNEMDSLKQKVTEIEEKSQPEREFSEGEVNSLRKINGELENELNLIREENFKLREELATLNDQLEQQGTRFSQLQWEHETYINELKSELDVQLTTEFVSITC